MQEAGALGSMARERSFAFLTLRIMRMLLGFHTQGASASALMRLNEHIAVLRFYVDACRSVGETIMAQAIIDYLERRYVALEKEIDNALHQDPVDALAIADLRYRKLIIADEINHHRGLAERFETLSAD